eukprot:g3292.t1
MANKGLIGPPSPPQYKENYQIVWADDPETLQTVINRMIKKGYRPQGGICVAYHPINLQHTWAQAMSL